jgi:hypothetical protein
VEVNDGLVLRGVGPGEPRSVLRRRREFVERGRGFVTRRGRNDDQKKRRCLNRLMRGNGVRRK